MNDSMIKIDRLIRSKRKTVGLEISKKLELIVRAPYHLPMQEIENILRKKLTWINKTREKLKAFNAFTKQKSFTEGEIFYLKGEKFTLYSIKPGKNSISIKNNKLFLSKKPGDNTRTIFIKWYKKIAKEFLNERVEIYSKLTGLYPASVRITSANKRWGSCSGKNNINFSYKLIMVPVKIIDYVVVHELIHIKEKNHSSSFWLKVKDYIPDYKERRKWLKENGYLFNI